MHFGIFMEFESRQGRSQAESFREGFDLVEAADTWGLDAVWLGLSGMEHDDAGEPKQEYGAGPATVIAG